MLGNPEFQKLSSESQKILLDAYSSISVKEFSGYFVIAFLAGVFWVGGLILLKVLCDLIP
jgi:hypothetical protein